MNVLVTGASGFVGTSLVPELLRRGHRVRASTRAGMAIDGAEMIRCRELSEGAEDIVTGMDAVVHLAGIAHVGREIPDAQYDLINRAATDALAHASARAGVARFVFMSSIRAQSGPTAPAVVTERDAANPTDAYGRSKLAAETCIRASGTPYTILRPVLIYGPRVKGNLAALSRLASLPLPLPFGSFTNRRSLLSLRHLVQAIILALTDPRLANETFVVADKHPASLRDIISALQQARGRKPSLVPVPAGLLRLAIHAARKPEIWDRLHGELVVDSSKLELAGWTPATNTCLELQAMGAETLA